MAEQQAPKPNIVKSFLIAVVALVVIVSIILGLGLVNLPAWPFVFFLFYFTTVVGMAKEKLVVTAVGGFVGITVGFSQGLINLLTGDETISMVIFLAIIVVLVTAVIDGRLKVIDPLCLMMLTCLTSFTGITPPEQYLGSLVTYAIVVAIFSAVVFLQGRKKKE